MEHQPFSVAMCVYGKDNAEWFNQSIESISSKQTIKPSEIVLIVDGPITEEIESVIVKQSIYLSDLGIDFVVERFETNQGHGVSRRKSVDLCTYDLIALMDSDDISLPNRFDDQLRILNEKNADIVGGNISEFIGNEDNTVSFRNVPIGDNEIKAFAKTRCPMNQVTVMFRKKAYDEAGGYVDWFWEEDYYLWLRMIKNKASFANTGTVLVNVRVGEDMYKRRGGIKYYKSEKKLQKYMLDEKFISLPKYCVNCLKRFIVQVLLPNKIRGWVFKKFARS